VPRRGKLLSDATAGYLAGLLDGEGCLSVRGSEWSRPSIEVVMTTPAPLILAKKWTGCGNVYSAKEKRENRRIPWRWVVCSIREISRVLDAVQKHLVVKWAEAQVLRIFTTLRRGRKMGGPRLDPEADNRLKRLSTLMKLDTPDLEAVYQEALDLCVYLRQAIEERRACEEGYNLPRR
jgi:hypothetical protein